MDLLFSLFELQSFTGKMVWTIIVVGLFLLFRNLATRSLENRLDDVAQHYWLIKASRYVLGLISFIILVRIWLGGVHSLVSYLGILSAGLAIALQDPLANLAGWIFITIRAPFQVGDRIELGGVAGDVIDQRLFGFSVLEVGNWVGADQSTGRIVHIPNGQVFKLSLANYTQGFDFVWHELPVTITFESNWRHAKQLLEQILKRHSMIPSEEAEAEIHKAARRYMIFFRHLTPIIWISVVESGVMLTLRLPCRARRRRSTDHAIWEEILDAFSEAEDIDFAYPTTRFYNNSMEGKPGTKMH